MKSPHHSPNQRCAKALGGRRIELRWTAVVSEANDRLKACAASRLSLCRVTFVIALLHINEQHAILEAWLETPSGRRTIITRRTVACEVAFDGTLLHIDAYLDSRRIVALSMAPDDPHQHLLYAQSPLPSEAGLGPGACDPPTAGLHAIERDAASA